MSGLVGAELGPTAWIEVTQQRIDPFAAGTDDPQWIHADSARAAAVRLPAPIPSGGRFRGRFRVLGVEATPGGARATIEATVECDGVGRPVCVAQLVVLSVS